ncbi:MAG: hypothetical protein R2795_18540 [Saprospiraceae bacterium]
MMRLPVSTQPVQIGQATVADYTYQWSNGDFLDSDIISDPTVTIL